MRACSGKRWRECWVAGAVATALAACDGADQTPGNWRGTMTTLPSGVVVISNPDEGMWPASDAWTLTEDLRIGRPDGEGPDVFWKIIDFEVGPGGDVFVMDQSQEVRQFRSTGEFVRTLGRQGEGPGEFQGAIGVAFDPEGNAWVADGNLKRYSVFGPDGTLQRIVSMPSPMVGAFEPWVGAFDSMGRLYETSLGAPSMTEIPFTSIRLDQAGHVDTVPALSYEFPLFNGYPPPPDVMSRLMFSFDTAGTVRVARTDQYRIVHQTLDSSDTLRIIERPLAPIALTDAERDSLVRQFERADVRLDQIPVTRPVIEQILAGPDGTLLVQLVTAPTATESVFDVFDGEGRLLGQVRTPVRLAEGMLAPSPKIYGDLLWGVATDSLGVQHLRRYRIETPAGATARAN